MADTTTAVPLLDKKSLRKGSLEKNPRLSQWLRIDRDGTVSIYSGKVEIGQGILTALAQIAAEALDIDVSRIRMIAASTDRSPDEGVTSGSLSVQESGSALRLVCAEARVLLIHRAAERLKTTVEALRIDDGLVTCDSGSVRFWELDDDALLDREVSGDLSTAASRENRFVGTNTARFDLPDKITGRPRFIQDMTLPGMLFGRVVRPSHGYLEITSCAEDKVKKFPGIIELVRDGNFLGVLTEREEVAIAAMRKLRDASEWKPVARLPSEIHSWLRKNAVDHRTISEKSEEPVRKRAAKTLSSSYAKPFISHASIGPSCAIAQFEGERLTVWTHSQSIFNLRRDLAIALRMREGSIVVRHVEGSGCYGHNGADDVALDAALLARKAQGRPVQVQWMREDEFGWAPCGPAMALDLEASLDAEGNIVDWRHELWSNGHSHRPGRSDNPTLVAAQHLARPFARPSAINMSLPAGAADRNAVPLYDFPNQRIVNHYAQTMPVRTSALRSLGAYANVFAIESFMDELACSANIDTIAFRLRHLRDERARAVIEAAARRAGWTQWKKSEGRGHGIAFAKYKNLGAYCAAVAEIEAGHELRVTRLVLAVDVGRAINSDGVVNQIEGGAIQSASWTLKEEVKLGEFGIASLAWEDYPILKFSEVPAVEVEIIDRPELPSVGAGEAAQGPVAAAIANALHDALGVRVRELPLTPERIVAAMDQA